MAVQRQEPREVLMHRIRFLAVGVACVLGAGCPLEHAKKDGFLDRAQAKDMREAREGTTCARGERYMTKEECAEAQKHFGVTDCQRICLTPK